MAEAKMSVAVRSKTAIWLVGAEEQQLIGCKLPSNRQVLSIFFNQHKTLNKTVRDSSRTVIRETAVFWDKACIPMRLEKHAITKLEQLHQKWMSLKKNAS